VNKDQISGKVEQVLGKVEQNVGETVGIERLANQGVVDQAKGAVKETWGNAKDAARGVQQSHKNATTDKAHERAAQQPQSVSAKRQGESQREDRRIQGAAFRLMWRDSVKRKTQAAPSPMLIIGRVGAG
jgi:uncharacterized protein YjbJ (UPF0337 family)